MDWRSLASFYEYCLDDDVLAACFRDSSAFLRCMRPWHCPKLDLRPVTMSFSDYMAYWHLARHLTVDRPTRRDARPRYELEVDFRYILKLRPHSCYRRFAASGFTPPDSPFPFANAFVLVDDHESLMIYLRDRHRYRLAVEMPMSSAYKQVEISPSGRTILVLDYESTVNLIVLAENSVTRVQTDLVVPLSRLKGAFGREEEFVLHDSNWTFFKYRLSLSSRTLEKEKLHEPELVGATATARKYKMFDKNDKIAFNFLYVPRSEDVPETLVFRDTCAKGRHPCNNRLQIVVWPGTAKETVYHLSTEEGEIVDFLPDWERKRLFVLVFTPRTREGFLIFPVSAKRIPAPCVEFARKSFANIGIYALDLRGVEGTEDYLLFSGRFFFPSFVDAIPEKEIDAPLEEKIPPPALPKTFKTFIDPRDGYAIRSVCNRRYLCVAVNSWRIICFALAGRRRIRPFSLENVNVLGSFSTTAEMDVMAVMENSVYTPSYDQVSLITLCPHNAKLFQIEHANLFEPTAELPAVRWKKIKVNLSRSCRNGPDVESS